MMTPESQQLRQRREYMIRLSQQPASVLIADPQRVKFGIKILEMQYRKLEKNKLRYGRVTFDDWMAFLQLYKLRAQGMSWRKIAVELGYSTKSHELMRQRYLKGMRVARRPKFPERMAQLKEIDDEVQYEAKEQKPPTH